MGNIRIFRILLFIAVFSLLIIFSSLSPVSAKNITRLPLPTRPILLPRLILPPIPTIVLPRPPKFPKPTITPTATLTPTQTPTPNYSFFDIFSGDQIDTEKWNVSENGGSVTLEDGTLVLDNLGDASPYPFIDTKPNPFLGFTYGNYRVTTHFRFIGEAGNPYGLTFAVQDGEQPQNQTLGNSPYVNARSFWIVMSGEFRFGFGVDLVSVKPYDNVWHTLMFERKNGVSTIYFDGEIIGTSTLNFAASNIWFGLTNSLGFGNNQYPKLILDGVFVETE